MVEQLIKKFSKEEVALHNKEDDLWVVINEKVYDLTKFYATHPGGPQAILDFAGRDGTKSFEDAEHTVVNKKELATYLIGEYKVPRIFTKLNEISDHNLPNDLWLLINEKVYDVTNFKHPGGKEILLQNAGQDATTQFEDINHSEKADMHMKDLYIGDFINPETQKESWMAYVKRKDQEEKEKMPFMQKCLLIALFAVVFFFLYSHLTADKIDTPKEAL